jgi:Sel1 repeat
MHAYHRSTAVAVIAMALVGATANFSAKAAPPNAPPPCGFKACPLSYNYITKPDPDCDETCQAQLNKANNVLVQATVRQDSTDELRYRPMNRFFGNSPPERVLGYVVAYVGRLWSIYLPQSWNDIGRVWFDILSAVNDPAVDISCISHAWHPADVESQLTLGIDYATGRCLKRDPVQAVYWFRKAAERGYALAQYRLGQAFDEGSGVPQDYAEAAAWDRKAVDVRHSQ